MFNIPDSLRTVDWKYSIREIILIVIGILIALAINNWNENRKTYQDETEMLRELRTSLTNDLEDIEININTHEASYRSLHLLLDHLKSGRPYHDSLDTHFGLALGSTFFLSDNVAYNTLRERGRQLVSNLEIRSRLSILYAHDYAFIKGLEEIDRQFLLTGIQPYYAKNFRDFTLFQSATPIDYDHISTDSEFIGILEWFIGNRMVTLPRYREIRSKVLELIDLIDRELADR